MLASIFERVTALDRLDANGPTHGGGGGAAPGNEAISTTLNKVSSPQPAEKPTRAALAAIRSSVPPVVTLWSGRPPALVATEMPPTGEPHGPAFTVGRIGEYADGYVYAKRPPVSHPGALIVTLADAGGPVQFAPALEAPPTTAAREGVPRLAIIGAVLVGAWLVFA